MIPSGPFTIVDGQSVALQPPSASIRFVAVKISNSSPFGCQLSSPGVGPWLDAWSWALVTLNPGDLPEVSAVFSTDSSGLITSGNLTATWYLPDDELPPETTGSLTSQAIAAALAGIPTVSISGTPTVDISTGNITVVNTAQGSASTNVLGDTTQVANVTVGSTPVTILGVIGGAHFYLGSISGFLASGTAGQVVLQHQAASVIGRFAVNNSALGPYFLGHETTPGENVQISMTGTGTIAISLCYV